MTQHQTVLIPDFGGQYTFLIARRVRELGVYCEICPPAGVVERAKTLASAGVILTGGPKSVYLEESPKIPAGLFALGIPVLGICYGAHLMAHTLGGTVQGADKGEYGGAATRFTAQGPLLEGFPPQCITWMNHRDRITAVPDGFSVIAETDNCAVAAMQDEARRLYAVQFHPEVAHTEQGERLLRNFLYGICGCAGDWRMDENHIQGMIESIRAQVGSERVVLGLSGGVDSSVLAALLGKAVGRQLTCIFVDHGLMRLREGDDIEAAFAGRELQFKRVNAGPRFLERLKGVTDPERKRKIIGEEFIRVFEEETKALGFKAMLSQGTIYPDVVESGRGDADVIKSHHNVGGLPKDMDFTGLVEPLRDLFKDEVRAIGTQLGLPDSVVWRQPFPGPGLAVRLLGEITTERLDILRLADHIFREEIEKAGLGRDIHQFFAVLTNLRTVGVMGDARTYHYTLALRGVTTVDFMTADFARIPYEVLAAASSRITNEVPQIGRVVYDVTSKPPATIEWE